MSSKSIVIIAASGIALAGGVGVYLYMKHKSPAPPPNPNPVNPGGDMSWCPSGGCGVTRKSGETFAITSGSDVYQILKLLNSNATWKYMKPGDSTYTTVSISGMDKGPITFNFTQGQKYGMQTYACWSCDNPSSVNLLVNQSGQDDPDDGIVNVNVTLVSSSPPSLQLSNSYYNNQPIVLTQ